jgi:hypothetical protein
MTKLLEKAFQEASTLSEEDQDTLAALLLEEMADEARWDKAFAESPDLLEKLGDEALAEIRAGKTLPLDPDRL